MTRLSLALVCSGILLLGVGTDAPPALAQAAVTAQSAPCQMYFGEVNTCGSVSEPGTPKVFTDVGNLKAGNTPWYTRLAAGAGSVAKKRFGVSLRDLERSGDELFDFDAVQKQICSVDRDKCLKELNDAAERGDPFALSVRVLHLGEVSPQDTEDQRADAIAAAVSDLETAAETGFPFAQTMLGSLLVFGEAADFVGIDAERGRQLLSDAIAQKWGGAGWAVVELANAQPDLISLLPDRMKGLGLAAERGIPIAQFEMGRRLLWGHGSELTANGLRKHSATLRNNADWLGFTLSKDNDRGLRLIERAVEAGYTSGATVLGRILKTGMFEPYEEPITAPRPAEAYRIFRQCPYFECRIQAAYMLAAGKGVGQNRAAAIRDVEDMAVAYGDSPRLAEALLNLRSNDVAYIEDLTNVFF